MISRILGKIKGEYVFSAEENQYISCVNIFKKHELWPYREKLGNGNFRFTLKKSEGKIFTKKCLEEGLEIKRSSLRGIPGFLCRYRRRFGAMVGAAFFILSTFFSKYFIWDFRVVGNENVSDEEIVSQLEELGCGCGAFIPSIDFELVANEFLIKSDDIAWISVNMRSSLAVVEVAERKKGEKSVAPPRGTYANLTASEDAEIILPEINSGKSTVSVGETVRKGELLASGAITVGENGIRYEYASGEVLGKVYREIVAEIPLESEEKVYTGNKKKSIGVKIFGKKKNLFSNSSINYTKYDKIERNSQLTFFGSVTVPIWLTVQTDAEYEYRPKILTESEAAEKAKIAFADGVRELLEEGEILSSETEEKLEDGVYRMTGRIYMIKNIAVCSEFTVNDGETKGSANDP